MCDSTILDLAGPVILRSALLGSVARELIRRSSRLGAVLREHDPRYDAIEFGAAWKKSSGEGRAYLSIKLDDPSFPAPIYATVIEGEEAGSCSLIWSRRSGD
ncbi:MAG: DUF736 domain-containing protein [Alphaproteobacteria bacterium]|nr:DUF736 domain-containing protein [Alphaproteobacteria bacterium]